MSNMGYGGDGVPAGAMTPGHHSMGAPTPYRSEIDEVRYVTLLINIILMALFSVITYLEQMNI